MEGYSIKPLARTQIPRSHIVLAVESRLGGDRAGYEQTWRIGALEAWRNGSGPNADRPQLAFDDPGDLWRVVSQLLAVRGVTFLWCHDLSWTSRVAAMFVWLPQLGWTLDAFNLIPGSGWLVWRKGRHTLKVFDTLSIWQTGMDGLARLFKMGRKPLPHMEARHEAWLSRVWQDRVILSVAVKAYLNWVRDNDLGSLAVTGSGQGWNAFRRRFLTHGVLIHDNQPLRRMEREAMWAGRTEAWWHGSILTQAVDEWDFTMAHNTIGRTELLPVLPTMPVGPGEDVGKLLSRKNSALLAEVEVCTPEPVVPCRGDSGIIWPRGSFTTTLWSPELSELLRAGADVRILTGHLYRTAPVLKAWGDWIAAQLDQDDINTPAWLRLLLKRWSNTVVGRFGMRYPQWDTIGRSPHCNAFAIPLWDIDTDETTLLMQAGHDMFEQTGVSEPRYAAPMVTGYVMSAMRAKLWRLMKRMPAQSLLYMDTDSVLTTDTWRQAMKVLAREPGFEGLRLKRSWDGFAIYGPRQIVTGEEVRFSGLPKNATRQGRHEFEGEIVESLEQALGHNALDRVRISRKRWSVEGRDTRRVGNGVGWTEAHYLEALGDNDAQ